MDSVNITPTLTSPRKRLRNDAEDDTEMTGKAIKRKQQKCRLHTELSQAIHFCQTLARIVATAFSQGCTVIIENQSLRVSGFDENFIKEFLVFESQFLNTHEKQLLEIYQEVIRLYAKAKQKSSHGIILDYLREIMCAIFAGGNVILCDKSSNCKTLFGNEYYKDWKGVIEFSKMFAVPGIDNTNFKKREPWILGTNSSPKYTATYFAKTFDADKLALSGLTSNDVNELRNKLMELRNFEKGTLMVFLKYVFRNRDNFPALYAIVRIVFLQTVVKNFPTNDQKFLHRAVFLWDQIICNFEEFQQIVLDRDPSKLLTVIQEEHQRLEYNVYLPMMINNFSVPSTAIQNESDFVANIKSALLWMKSTFSIVENNVITNDFERLFKHLLLFLHVNKNQHSVHNNDLLKDLQNEFGINDDVENSSQQLSVAFDDESSGKLVFGHTETNIALCIYNFVCDTPKPCTKRKINRLRSDPSKNSKNRYTLKDDDYKVLTLCEKGDFVVSEMTIDENKGTSLYDTGDSSSIMEVDNHTRMLTNDNNDVDNTVSRAENENEEKNVDGEYHSGVALYTSEDDEFGETNLQPVVQLERISTNNNNTIEADESLRNSLMLPNSYFEDAGNSNIMLNDVKGSTVNGCSVEYSKELSDFLKNQSPYKKTVLMDPSTCHDKVYKPPTEDESEDESTSPHFPNFDSNQVPLDSEKESTEKAIPYQSLNTPQSLTLVDDLNDAMSQTNTSPTNLKRKGGSVVDDDIDSSEDLLRHQIQSDENIVTDNNKIYPLRSHDELTTRNHHDDTSLSFCVLSRPSLDERINHDSNDNHKDDSIGSLRSCEDRLPGQFPSNDTRTGGSSEFVVISPPSSSVEQNRGEINNQRLILPLNLQTSDEENEKLKQLCELYLKEVKQLRIQVDDLTLRLADAEQEKSDIKNKFIHSTDQLRERESEFSKLRDNNTAYENEVRLLSLDQKESHVRLQGLENENFRLKEQMNSQQQESDVRLRSLGKDIEEKRKTIEDLTPRLTSIERENVHLTEQIQEKESQLNILNGNNVVYKQQLESQQQDIEEKRTTLENLKLRVSESEKENFQLVNQLREKESQVDILSSNNTVYKQQLESHQQDSDVRYQRLCEEVKEKQTTVENLTSSLKDIENENFRLKNQMESQQQEFDVRYQMLCKDIEEKQTTVEELKMTIQASNEKELSNSMQYQSMQKQQTDKLCSLQTELDLAKVQLQSFQQLIDELQLSKKKAEEENIKCKEKIANIEIEICRQQTLSNSLKHDVENKASHDVARTNLENATLLSNLAAQKQRNKNLESEYNSQQKMLSSMFLNKEAQSNKINLLEKENSALQSKLHEINLNMVTLQTELTSQFKEEQSENTRKMRERELRQQEEIQKLNEEIKNHCRDTERFKKQLADKDKSLQLESDTALRQQEEVQKLEEEIEKQCRDTDRFKKQLADKDKELTLLQSQLQTKIDESKEKESATAKKSLQLESDIALRQQEEVQKLEEKIEKQCRDMERFKKQLTDKDNELILLQSQLQTKIDESKVKESATAKKILQLESDIARRIEEKNDVELNLKQLTDERKHLQDRYSLTQNENDSKAKEIAHLKSLSSEQQEQIKNLELKNKRKNEEGSKIGVTNDAITKQKQLITQYEENKTFLENKTETYKKQLEELRRQHETLKVDLNKAKLERQDAFDKLVTAEKIAQNVKTVDSEAGQITKKVLIGKLEKTNLGITRKQPANNESIQTKDSADDLRELVKNQNKFLANKDKAIAEISRELDKLKRKMRECNDRNEDQKRCWDEEIERLRRENKNDVTSKDDTIKRLKRCNNIAQQKIQKLENKLISKSFSGDDELSKVREKEEFLDKLPLVPPSPQLRSHVKVKNNYDADVISVLIRTENLKFKDIKLLDLDFRDICLSFSKVRRFHLFLEETRALLKMGKESPYTDVLRKAQKCNRLSNAKIYPVVVPVTREVDDTYMRDMFALIYFVGCIPTVQFVDCCQAKTPLCFLYDGEDVEKLNNRREALTAKHVIIEKHFDGLSDLAEAAINLLQWNAESITKFLRIR